MPSACLTAVTYGPSCRVHDRAGDAGEPDEAITHYSFNGGAYDCCRSIAHDSRQRLGLGLAGGWGWGPAAEAVAAGAIVYPYYGYGYGYPGYGYGYAPAYGEGSYGYGYPSYGYDFETDYYGGYRYGYHPVIRHADVRRSPKNKAPVTVRAAPPRPVVPISPSEFGTTPR